MFKVLPGPVVGSIGAYDEARVECPEDLRDPSSEVFPAAPYRIELPEVDNFENGRVGIIRQAKLEDRVGAEIPEGTDQFHPPDLGQVSGHKLPRWIDTSHIAVWVEINTRLTVGKHQKTHPIPKA